MSVKETIENMARSAKAAAAELGRCPGGRKNAALLQIADQIEADAGSIKTENAKDVAAAEERGLSAAMIDRLRVTDATIASMAGGLREVARLEDPVGTASGTWIRPNGLEVSRMRIPLGVVGIIYESRPNVTIDAAGLCLKAGNAVILRGGSEALSSNQALAASVAKALRDCGLPEKAVQIVPLREREAVNVLLQQQDYIDLIIPRGGESLIRFVVDNSRIPVLKHYKGVCHVYVDQSADLSMARQVCLNAKVQRPGVCNAMETLLIHESVAPQFLPEMADQFLQAGVELRGCEKSCALVPSARPAEEADWYEEYLDLVLAVKVVSDMDAALAHIACYGSNHTEAIITSDYNSSRRFLREADASVVLVNASTRFNDGGQLGLGAEMGISTSKLHAYGPMGVDELTTTKFVVCGSGQMRS
ncbi:MAG: glutamate-5-semialdehyde dehydrogenase [Desulfosalsimonadaceae bacterium]